MGETRELTRPLIEKLNQSGGLALRMNSGKVKVKGGYVQLHEEGTADILFFPRNPNPPLCRGWYQPVWPVWIETKTGRTKPERVKKQAEFRAKVEALGHRYILARTMDEGLEALR